jgi:hypothetical protein
VVQGRVREFKDFKNHSLVADFVALVAAR